MNSLWRFAPYLGESNRTYVKLTTSELIPDRNRPNIKGGRGQGIENQETGTNDWSFHFNVKSSSDS
jgi:hypothetical protein